MIYLPGSQKTQLDIISILMGIWMYVQNLVATCGDTRGTVGQGITRVRGIHPLEIMNVSVVEWLKIKTLRKSYWLNALINETCPSWIKMYQILFHQTTGNIFLNESAAFATELFNYKYNGTSVFNGKCENRRTWTEPLGLGWRYSAATKLPFY